MICLILGGCSKRDERVEYYNDGGFKSKVQLLDGLRDGAMTTFYSSGEILGKYTYRKDSLSGPYEVYYPEGILAEKGVMRNGNRFGEVFQFYWNGKTHYKHYMLSVNGKPFPYYTIEFDSLGNIISDNRKVEVDISRLANGGYAAHIQILEKYVYDSVKIVWGDFDSDFRQSGSIDSLKASTNSITVEKNMIPRENFLRGYLIRYKTIVREGSIVNFKSYTYFEKSFWVMVWRDDSGNLRSVTRAPRLETAPQLVNPDRDLSSKFISLIQPDTIKSVITTVAIIVISTTFILLSFCFYKSAMKAKHISIVVLLAVAYLILIHPYFELINYLHQKLRSGGILIEFGHGSTTLLVLWFLAYVFAFIVIVSTVTRWSKDRKNKTSES
jgi:hypothetical protein